MRTLYLILSLSLVAPLACRAEAPPVFALALASDTPQEGYQPTPFLHPPKDGPNEIYVESKPRFTSADIESAQHVPDQQGLPSVAVTLTEKAGQRMLALTKQATGQRMAVIINGKVLTAPVIHGSFGQSFYVSGGNMSREEAHELANALSPTSTKSSP